MMHDRLLDGRWTPPFFSLHTSMVLAELVSGPSAWSGRFSVCAQCSFALGFLSVPDSKTRQNLTTKVSSMGCVRHLPPVHPPPTAH